MSRAVLVLLSVLLCHLLTVVGQQCNDCIEVTRCERGLALAQKNDQASQRQLRNVFCGFKNNNPQVCCSQLGDSLDRHPGLALLPQDCGFVDGNRIVGGGPAGLYEFPWMVLISYKTRDGLKFQCGGSLINSRYVLTAAHCIKGLNIAGVRVGEYDYRTVEDCVGQHEIQCESSIQDIRVAEPIVHPEYSGKPGPVLNDIGLLRLKKEVNFTPKNAKPICLPISSSLRQRALAGENATLAGWGFTEEHLPSPVLMTVNVPVHTPEDCRFSYHKGKLSESQPDLTVNKLCAGEKGKDSCSGDSGGPLMVAGLHSGKSRYIQYGVVSTGPRNCGSGAAGYYTDVSKYMQWILDTIKP